MLKSYIIEEKAIKMWETLTLNFKNGCYKKFSDGDALAFQLNQELFKISNDLHLKVLFSKKPLMPILGDNPTSDEEEIMLLEFLKKKIMEFKSNPF